MPNWTREKPTEAGLPYWYKPAPKVDAVLGKIGFNIDKFEYQGDIYSTKHLNGWWAKADPPEWDGE